MSVDDVTGARDAFYEWLLSDAPAARAERIRRREANAARAERELTEVGAWCERTLGNPNAPTRLRALAETLTRVSTRHNAREAAAAAVPDEVWVTVERHRYEAARHVAGDFDYRYPARYLGTQAAEQPVPDEVVSAGALRPGDRLRLARTGPVLTVARVETADQSWDLHTTDGRRVRFSQSASVRRVHDTPDRSAVDRDPPERSPTDGAREAPPDPQNRSRQDPGLEL